MDSLPYYALAVYTEVQDRCWPNFKSADHHQDTWACPIDLHSIGCHNKAGYTVPIRVSLAIGVSSLEAGILKSYEL